MTCLHCIFFFFENSTACKTNEKKLLVNENRIKIEGKKNLQNIYVHIKFVFVKFL